MAGIYKIKQARSNRAKILGGRVITKVNKEIEAASKGGESHAVVLYDRYLTDQSSVLVIELLSKEGYRVMKRNLKGSKRLEIYWTEI